MSNEEKLKELLKTKTIIESGFAGILQSGEIVDRQIKGNENAIPIQKNRLFNTPTPKYENDLCKCGHIRKQHKVSNNINYTELNCNNCECKFFNC